MYFNTVNFKSSGLGVVNPNNKLPAPQVLKTEKKEDNSKALYLTLAGLATAIAVGYGIHRYVKKGKPPKIDNKPSGEVKPLEPKLPPKTGGKADPKTDIPPKESPKVVTETKEVIEAKKEVSKMTPEQIANYKFSDVVDSAINAKKDLAGQLETCKEEKATLEGLLRNASKLKDDVIAKKTNSIDVLYQKSLYLLNKMLIDMDKLKFVAASQGKKEEKLVAVVVLKDKIKIEMIEYARLRKEFDIHFKELSSILDSLKNK